MRPRLNQAKRDWTSTWPGPEQRSLGGFCDPDLVKPVAVQYLLGELVHVELQTALVFCLLTHLDQDVKVTVLLCQSGSPLVLTQFHCNTQPTRSRSAWVYGSLWKVVTTECDVAYLAGAEAPSAVGCTPSPGCYSDPAGPAEGAAAAKKSTEPRILPGRCPTAPPAAHKERHVETSRRGGTQSAGWCRVGRKWRCEQQ